MWAYRSYNDNAPAEPEPRFAVPLDDNKGKGSFSWSSLYSLRKGGSDSPNSPLKSPFKSLAGILGSRPKAPDRRLSRRRSLSSVLSRRSDRDDRDDKLEEILDKLEMLQLRIDEKDGSKRRGAPSVSSRGSKLRFADDDDDGDDESDESDAGRRTRPSVHRRDKSPTASRYSRQDSLGTVAEDAFRAAALEWHAQGTDKKFGIKERVKSSLKAGAKEAGKSSLRQVKQSFTGGSPTSRTSIGSANSDEMQAKPNPITSQLSDFSSVGMGGLAAMLKGKREEESKRPTKADELAGKDEDRHKRFKKEYLDMPDASPEIDEDLLDDLLPPADGFELEPHTETPSKIRKGREKLESRKTDDKSDARLRPLHYDPSLPSVQSFAWPDADEIAEHAQEGKKMGKSASRTDKISQGRASSSRAGPSSKSRDGRDMDELMQQMMSSRGPGGVKDLFNKAASNPGKSTSPGKGKDPDVDELMQQMMRGGIPGRRSQNSQDKRETAKIFELSDSEEEEEPDMRDLMRTMRSAGTSKQRGMPDEDEPDISKSDFLSGFGDDEPDMDQLMQQMMRSAGTAGHEDSRHEVGQRSKPSGRVPSPLNTRTRSLRLGNPDQEEPGRDTRGLVDDGFGIAWPSTPTHDPGYDSLPEYVSPATEAFNRAQEESRHEGVSEHRAIPMDEQSHPPVTSQDQVLFRRVVATMTSCLGKAKALAQKQHQYQGERLSTSAESMVLRVIGSWLMKQIPPLERANELFSFAESECMFGFLEELVRMDGLLSHPVLHRERWESDVYEHLQTETESLQRCFLGVAVSAVVSYLQHKCSRLTEDMPRILYTCDEMLKERPRDPSQVLLVLPKIRAQLRDARGRSESRYGSQVDEAEGLLDILYELTIELGGSFPADSSRESREDEPSQPEPRQFARDIPEIANTPGGLDEMPSWNTTNGQDRARDFETRSLSMNGSSDFEVAPRPVDQSQSPRLPDNGAPAGQRGFAADFFEAPTPGPSGFSAPVLEDLERKQDAVSRGSQRPPLEPSTTKRKAPAESGVDNATYEQAAPPKVVQTGDSLLMAERPRAAPVMPLEYDNEVSSDQEGKGSSSSSDEGGYASGMDASSILPLLLRKKLEGKRKTLSKPPLSSKLGLTTREQPRPLLNDREAQENAPATEVVSRESPAGSIAKSRSPGSYFPPSESLAVVPKSQEEPREALRMRPAPVTHKPSVYTPITASPLRASTSLMSPEELTAGVGVEQQRPSVISTPMQERPDVMAASGMTTPTGMVFSNPFANDPTATLQTAPQATSDDGRFYTPMASPTTADMELDAAADAAMEDVDSATDNQSITSNEVMTSDDVRAGLLDGLSDDEMDDSRQALTEAEKDLAAVEPEALIPGPREIITASRTVRDMTQYDDFPDTYRGAVPRVEVTPGAIQNTKGEVIPIDDEDIHLAAGETLIDGTGRVWNAKGMIEPGRDDRGLPILYEVDIAQIKRANNGELPLMMPWDDERLLPDGSRTPSDTPSDDIESATPMSEVSSASDAWEPPLRPKRRISEDLNAVDEQLMASAGVDDIPETEEDDVPPDDMAMREEEEAEETREEEYQQMKRRTEEERRMGSTP